MKSEILLRASAISAALFCCAGPRLALAQDAASGSDQAQALEEIVVTARQKSENLESSPVAVTAINEMALRAMIPEDLRDIGRYAPNVSIGAIPGFRAAAISIRGVSTGDIPASFDPSIGVAVDGVFVGAAQSALLDAFDLDNIQILRGPQGTLFGKNTIGGVVVVTTKRPTGNLDADADVRLGNYGRADFRGSVDFPIIDDVLSGRVAILSQNSDGYSRDAKTGQGLGGDDLVAGRAKLLYKPDDSLTALLTFDFDHDRSGTPPVVNTTPAGSAFYFLGFTDPLADRGTLNPLGDPHVTGQVPNTAHTGIEAPEHDFDIWGTTANIDYVTDFGTLTSITGFRYDRSKLYNDYFGEDIPLYATQRQVNRATTSEELRFAGKVTDRFDYVVGLYYQNNNFYYTNHTSLGPAFTGAPVPVGLIALGSQDDNSYAVFGEADTHITDDLKLVTGVRYSYEEKNFTLQPLGLPTAFPNSDSWHNVTFRVGPQYDFSQDIHGYFTFSTGFKSGGFNEQAGDAFTIGPFNEEKAESWEVGLKSELFERRLRLNLTGFYTTYTQLQLDSVVPIPNPPFQESAITNAGKEEVYGVETEIQARPIPELTLTGSFGYLHAEYLSFRTVLPGTTNLVDAVFLRPKRSPEFTGSLGADYDLNTSLGAFTFHIDTTYTSSFFNDTFNSASSQADAVNLWNASVTYTTEDDKYSLTLWGRNILDRTYRTSGLDVAGLWGFSTYGDPATFGVELRARF